MDSKHNQASASTDNGIPTSKPNNIHIYYDVYHHNVNEAFIFDNNNTVEECLFEGTVVYICIRQLNIIVDDKMTHYESEKIHCSIIIATNVDCVLPLILLIVPMLINNGLVQFGNNNIYCSDS